MRRVSGAGGRPTISSGTVSRAGVEQDELASVWVVAAPYNHLTTGPHCRVTVSGSGRIHIAGSCPSVLDASANRRG